MVRNERWDYGDRPPKRGLVRWLNTMRWGVSSKGRLPYSPKSGLMYCNTLQCPCVDVGSASVILPPKPGREELHSFGNVP